MNRFKEMFEAATKKAGKEQYLIPYFIAAHPGTTDEGHDEPCYMVKEKWFSC